MSKVFEVEISNSNDNFVGVLCGTFAYVAMLFKDEGCSYIESFILLKAMFDIEPVLDINEMSEIKEIIEELYEGTDSGSVDEFINQINHLSSED